MVQRSLDTLRGAKLAEVAAEFARTKPVVLVICNPTVERDVKTATDLANCFRGWGVEANTFAQVMAGCEDEVEVRERIPDEVAKTDIYIEVLSIDGNVNNEGFQVAMTKAALNDPKEVPEGRTRMFSVVATSDEVDDVVRTSHRRYYGNEVGVWNNEPSTQKRLLLGMLFAGPQTRKAEL